MGPNESDYNATILVCGGTEYTVDPNADSDVKALRDCKRLNPLDSKAKWQDDDWLFDSRNAGEFVQLPDGTALLLNGNFLNLILFN